MSPDLTPGLQYSESLRVTPALTVPAVSHAFAGFKDMPAVFATAFMVGFIESACIEALRPYLEPDERTVGTHIDVSHLAATPVGVNVTVSLELLQVEGRRLRFKVLCRDDFDIIGQGFHERTVVHQIKFLARLREKALKGTPMA
jgi:fluoroacetyl-CoA thioesterase